MTNKALDAKICLWGIFKQVFDIFRVVQIWDYGIEVSTATVELIEILNSDDAFLRNSIVTESMLCR